MTWTFPEGIRKDGKPGQPSDLVGLGKVRQIQNEICKEFQIPRRALLSKCRKVEFARPRQVAMYLARDLSTLSDNALAKILERDRSTIRHGYRTIADLIEIDRALRCKVFNICMSLKEKPPVSDEAPEGFPAQIGE